MTVRELALPNTRVHASTTFLILWQLPGETRYRTIGRLSRDLDGYTFTYVGAAQRGAGFLPLRSLPDTGSTLRSPALFPVFANRVTQAGRDDFREHLQRLDIDEVDPEPFELLSRTMGQRQTDRILALPIPVVQQGVMSATFFVHGSRHVDPDRANVARVAVGDPLKLLREPVNTVDDNAVLVLPFGGSDARDAVGYVPQVLARLVSHTIERGWEQAAFAGSVNTDQLMRTSDRLRVLARFFVRVPDGFDPEPLVTP